MAVFDPTVTANDASKMIESSGMLNASGKPTEAAGSFEFQTKGFIDARRTKRNVDTVGPELDIIKERKTVPVHIFNVGPFSHTIPCGSAGTFYIPACPEGKQYIEMLTPLHEIESEIYPKTRTAQAKRLHDDGRKMAQEIIGEGRGRHKSQSLKRVGVFVAAGDEPTASELNDARAEVYAYASEQIAIMDSLWDRDRKLAYDVYRPESYGACARALGLTGKEKPWLASGAPSDKIKCEWCQDSVDPSAPICANCKNPVNEEAYLALMAKKERLLAATAPAEKKAK